MPQIRIGSTAQEAFSAVFFAVDQGRFQEAGLNVDVTTLSTGTAVLSAVAGGAHDIGVATTVGLANAVIAGLPFVMIAPAALTTPESPGGVICVGDTSPVKSAKDLEGQTVVIPALKTASDLALRAWITQSGADLAKVRIVEATYPEMGPGLENGTYAAALLTEPFLSSAVRLGQARCIANPFLAVAPQYLLSAWFTTKDFAQKNPTAIRRIAAILTDAGTWANAHPFESAAVVANVASLDVDTLRASTRTVYAEEFRVSEIQTQLDAAQKFGLLSRSVSAGEMLLSH